MLYYQKSALSTEKPITKQKLFLVALNVRKPCLYAVILLNVFMKLGSNGFEPFFESCFTFLSNFGVRMALCVCQGIRID